jgi:hypothetical protein
MSSTTTPPAMDEVNPLGLTPEGTAALDNTAAMAEMQKAFAQIDALKQGQALKDEESPEEPDAPAGQGGQGEETTGTPTADSPEAATATPEEDKLADADQEPSVETPPDDKKKKRKDALWDIKREKYALLEEKEALAQENQRLKEMLEDSVYRGTWHYGKSAYASLDKAIADKKRALEEGDTDALIQADRDLIKAERAVGDLEDWLEAEKQKTGGTEKTAPSSEKTVTPPLSPAQAALAQDWMKEHPDLNPALPSYERDKAQQVAGFIHHLDAYITQNNLQHTYLSGPYFETIDHFIADLERPAPSKTTPATTPPASTAGSPSVAGVRNTYGASSGEKRKMEVVLTADEKHMARNAGIPEKEWLKYKIDDMRRP